MRKITSLYIEILLVTTFLLIGHVVVGYCGTTISGNDVTYTDHTFYGKVTVTGNNATFTRCQFLTVPGDIGSPGTEGFGVGVYQGALPAGFSTMTGTSTPSHANYGNYQFQDGSIMVWIPKFWYKVGTGANGLAVNVIDVRGINTYDTTAEANAAGYALHRAFIDGDSEQGGFFVDKYMCSKNAWGTGYIGSSIVNGLPISTRADHNPIADLTACSSNNYYQTINAAHARDGVDGAVNASSEFFVSSRFIYSALAMLSVAHGQAVSATTYCAWYDATNNFPKGCNNNALGDSNDGTVSYTSDGYSNCGKTGSGDPFAKTTHNGQSCGVADLNGLMWEVSLGITAITTNDIIEDISRANPANVQETGHTKSTGDYVMITGIEGGDWAGLDDKIYAVTKIDADNYTLDGVDTSGFALAYVQGTNHGTTTNGTFYLAKQATAMKDFTSGDSEATDHWGATGVAAMMDAFVPTFETGYVNNGYSQKFGSGANQVLSEATSGADWLLAGLGLPKDADGIDTVGTNLFGKDTFYQYIRNELCFLSCGRWANASNAGVWGLYWGLGRADSRNDVGFRAACYPY